MKLYAYSIYDRKAVIFHAPFFSHSDGSAARSFSDVSNDKSTNIGRHPSDYVLYRVGEFDDASGQLLSEHHVHICDAIALIEQQPTLFNSPPVKEA